MFPYPPQGPPYPQYAPGYGPPMGGPMQPGMQAGPYGPPGMPYPPQFHPAGPPPGMPFGPMVPQPPVQAQQQHQPQNQQQQDHQHAQSQQLGPSGSSSQSHQSSAPAPPPSQRNAIKGMAGPNAGIAAPTAGTMQHLLMEEPPLPGMALAEELDQRLLIQLRDGRKILGTLRTFDQFANMVVEGSVERIIVGDQYGDIPMGFQIIRGENVVLLGRVEPDREVLPGLTQVSGPAIKALQRGERELTRLKGQLRARMDFLDLGE